MHGYSYSFKDLINKTKPLKELNTGDIGYFDKDKYFYITSNELFKNCKDLWK